MVHIIFFPSLTCGTSCIWGMFTIIVTPLLHFYRLTFRWGIFLYETLIFTIIFTFFFWGSQFVQNIWKYGVIHSCNTPMSSFLQQEQLFMLHWPLLLQHMILGLSHLIFKGKDLTLWLNCLPLNLPFSNHTFPYYGSLTAFCFYILLVAIDHPKH